MMHAGSYGGSMVAPGSAGGFSGRFGGQTSKDKAREALAVVARGGGVDGVDQYGRSLRKMTIAEMRELTGKYDLPGSVIGPASLQRNARIAKVLWALADKYDWGVNKARGGRREKLERIADAYRSVGNAVGHKMGTPLNNGSGVWGVVSGCHDGIAERIDKIITNPLHLGADVYEKYWPAWLVKFKEDKIVRETSGEEERIRQAAAEEEERQRSAAAEAKAAATAAAQEAEAAHEDEAAAEEAAAAEVAAAALAKSASSSRPARPSTSKAAPLAGRKRRAAKMVREGEGDITAFVDESAYKPRPSKRRAAPAPAIEEDHPVPAARRGSMKGADVAPSAAADVAAVGATASSLAPSAAGAAVNNE